MQDIYKISDRISSAIEARIDIGNRFDRQIVPFIWCFLWFVVSPLYSSKSMVLVGMGIRAFLFLYGTYRIIKRKKNPKFGVVLFAVAIGFFWDFLGGTLVPAFKMQIFERNLGLVFLLGFYLNSEEEIQAFADMFVGFVTVTIALVGFYQLATFMPIYNFEKFREFGNMHYVTDARLTGLAYETSNNASGFLVVAIGFLVSKLLYKGNVKNNPIILILLSINIAALYFTYTRAGYIAAAVIFLYATLRMFFLKKLSNKILFVVILLLMVFGYFYYVSIELQKSGQIQRIGDQGNLLARFDLYIIVLENLTKTIIGNGYYVDPSLNLFKLAQIYITTENIFFEWLFVFGLPATAIIVFFVFKEVYLLRKFVSQKNLREFSDLGYGILFAYIGIIINESSTTNWYYTIFIFYLMSYKFRKHYTFREEKIAKSVIREY